MTKKNTLSVLILLAIVCQFSYAEWMVSKEGAKLWNPNPMQNETCSWSGEKDRRGFASGPGFVVWYINDKPYQVSSGNYTNGKAEGNILIVSKNAHVQAIQENNGVYREVPIKIGDGKTKREKSKGAIFALDADDYKSGSQDFGSSLSVRTDRNGRKYFHGKTSSYAHGYFFGISFNKEDQIQPGDTLEIVVSNWGQARADSGILIGEMLGFITQYDRFHLDSFLGNKIIVFRPIMQSTFVFGQHDGSVDRKNTSWLPREPNKLTFQFKENNIDLLINDEFVISTEYRRNSRVEHLLFSGLELKSAVHSIAIYR